jgi:DNA mismatch endonuclease (patch repair protein)
MDVLTPRQRSHCMSRIRGRHTSPELTLRSALWAAGLRYRLHYGVVGKPDIALPKEKVAVFVDGCFWHGCPLHGVKPKTNSAFWAEKIGKNKLRDEKVDKTLRAEGWRVIRFWEHEVKKETERAVKAVVSAVERRRMSSPKTKR